MCFTSGLWELKSGRVDFHISSATSQQFCVIASSVRRLFNDAVLTVECDRMINTNDE